MKRAAPPSRTWPAKAERVGELLPLDRWHPAVAALLRESTRGGRWGVALSGGGDSVALLLSLWAHFPRHRRRLLALHFNHRLRGRASGEDERFCRRLCAALGVELVVRRWTRNRARFSEASAREARFAFFTEALREARARWLWLAHQQDDVAETVLMRLARGSGTAGLAAPRPVQVQPQGRLHVRPLLGLSKKELLAALRTAGVRWREDASNQTDRHLRNRVRRSLLPQWERISGRDVRAAAALSRERLQEDDDALEAWLEQLAPFQKQGRQLDLARLAGCPTAIWRRAVHRWLLQVRADTDLSRAGFDQLLAQVRRGGDTRFSLGAKAFAVVRGGSLILRRA